MKVFFGPYFQTLQKTHYEDLVVKKGYTKHGVIAQ